MKSESSNLKKNLKMLQNVVPSEMADKINDLLTKIATDVLDNMEEHQRLLVKNNMGYEKANN